MERMIQEIDQEEEDHELDKKSSCSLSKGPFCHGVRISHEEEKKFSSVLNYDIIRRSMNGQ